MAVYGHITKFNKGNARLSRHSSSPPSVSGSFISPRGRRFEYRPRGLINELQLILKNSPKRHFFVYKPRGLYTSKYGKSGTAGRDITCCGVEAPRWPASRCCRGRFAGVTRLGMTTGESASRVPISISIRLGNVARRR